MSASPERVRLTADEVAAVLRRAVELDAGDPTVPSGSELIEVGTLEQAAAEVGLSPDAVRQAVAELRVGALAAGPGRPAPAPARRLVGPPVAADQRVLTLTPEQALDRAGHALRRQLFELRRSEGGRALWRRRTDIASSVQRILDVTGRIKFSSVGSISVTAVPLPGGGRAAAVATTVREGRRSAAPLSLVRVEADLANLRPVVAAGAAVPAGVTLTAGTLISLLTGDLAFVVATGAGGVAAGGVGLGVARAWYRRQYGEVAELLGWLLDQVGRD